MPDTFSCCPELAELIGTDAAASGSIERFFRLSTVNNLEVLRNLFSEIRPKRTLEIGLGYGGSAMVFAASHRQAGKQPLAQHTAIDPFQNDWNNKALIALDEAGLRGYLDFRPEFSSLALPTLVREGARFELIFVDGSHFFDDVFIDFYFTTQLLAEGGIVAFDDCANPHVKKVLRFIRGNCACLRTIDLSRYRSDKGRGLRYRAAKAIGRTQLTSFRKTGPWVREWNVALKNF